MPDLPGSGPPEPDSAERLLEVIDRLRASQYPGVRVSPDVERLLLSTRPVGNTIPLSGASLLLYEVDGYALLSPPIK